jgi:hypothetical protein
MEQWEIDFNWLKIQHFVKDKFKTNQLPNLDTVLFIIGLQEIGFFKKSYSQEQKLDITTIGTMTVLSSKGFFRQKGVDTEGWPVWEQINAYEPENDTIKQNELKVLISDYFEKRYDIINYEQGE